MDAQVDQKLVSCVEWSITSGATEPEAAEVFSPSFNVGSFNVSYQADLNVEFVTLYASS